MICVFHYFLIFYSLSSESVIDDENNHMHVCVCIRSCHTFYGEESISSVVAWTGGFAERSSETELFPGMNFI